MHLTDVCAGICASFVCLQASKDEKRVHISIEALNQLNGYIGIRRA